MGSMETIVAVIAVFSIFALPLITALVLIFKKVDTVHKERMGLIQQGIIPPKTSKRKENPNRYITLRNGVVLVAIGIGITIGIIGIETLEVAVSNPFLFTTATTVLFLGIGYLVFFLITRNAKDYKNIDLDSDLEDDAE